MAKLKAYGRTEVGTIYSTTGARRYMSDGKILQNSGFGWKLYATVKPHLTPIDAQYVTLQAIERQRWWQNRELDELATKVTAMSAKVAA